MLIVYSHLRAQRILAFTDAFFTSEFLFSSPTIHKSGLDFRRPVTRLHDL